MLDFMPRVITKDNYREIIDTKFVWIGLVENLQSHVSELAAVLGFPDVVMERLNTAHRDEELSLNIRRDFIGNNQLAFEIYQYARDRLIKKE
jgi:hypothetical protein